MNLDVFNTHMELYPYVKNDFNVIEDMYTAEDHFSGEEVPCGYLIDDGKLYLPRGTSVSKLESIVGIRAKYIQENDPSTKMSREFHSLYDPRNELQEKSIKFLTTEKDHQLSLNLATGFGKAEPISRKIPTPTEQGWTRMGDLKVGDYVFGRDGEQTKILKIFEQGEQDIYKITFSDGRYSLCTDQHLWNVKTYKEGKYRTCTTKKLYDDYQKLKSTYVPRGNRLECFYKRYIPICERVNYPHRDVPVDPWVLGLFIGNGVLGEFPLTISSGIEEIPMRIARKYNWTFKRSSKKNYSYIFYDKNGKRIQTREFFKDLPEMIGKYSYEKTIPNIYVYNDPETRLELLKGLMDTDGSISESDGRFHTMYSSCSEKLLEQIRQILFSFGFRASITKDKRVDKYTNGFNGNLVLNIPNEFKRQFFSISSKYEIASKAYNYPQQDYYSDLRIKDIKIVKREEARCIMVDNQEHLYLTQDFIVTHNTFCVAYASTQLNEKTIIITPNEGLKAQWINTYHKMFNYRPKNLMNIIGSNIILGIMEDDIDEADIYFVNHATLRNYMSSVNGYALHKFFKKIKVGIKVYDEAHQDFMNTIMIDNFTNTNRTWYLTATFDRSDKTQSVCFKRAFSLVIGFGEMESMAATVKHVIYHVCNINSRPTPKDRGKVMGFRGLSAASYGKYAFLTDDNQTAYHAILMILEKIKNIEGKTLIFVPLIEAVDLVVKNLKRDHSEKTVAAYHSKKSRDEKESALKKDIIVTTIKSCGTGKDITGLRTCISLDPVASKIIAQQLIGRLRPYGKGKNTFFFDIVDIAFAPLNWWFKSRFKKIETLVKSVVYLNLDS